MAKKSNDLPKPEITTEQKDEAEQEIREKQKIVDYDTKEYPIEIIVEKYINGLEDDINELYVPDYQREFVWSDEHQSRFIESIFLGLPIPQILVADLPTENSEDLGRLEIVDGTQRIRTLCRFIQNDLRLCNLTKLTHLNGFRFNDLLLSRQRRFNRSTVRMIMLTKKADEEIRRDLFERINTGGIPLNNMEIRRGKFHGPLVELLEELAKESRFVKLCPLSEVSRIRREPEEFVLRFFAYLNGYKKFQGNVSEFLDNFLKKYDNNKLDKSNFRDQFIKMLDFVDNYFPNGFSKLKGHVRTPKIRFESISVGVALALNEKPDLVPKTMDWMDSEEFKKHTTAGWSNSKEKVIQRIEYVRDNLLK